jgi:hypothetical protein
VSKRRSKGTPNGRRASRPRTGNPVLAGVAARLGEAVRFAQVVDWIRAGRWHAPDSGEGADFRLPDDWRPPDDDGGLTASGVPRVPPDRSGSGSAAVVEPEDLSDSANDYRISG